MSNNVKWEPDKDVQSKIRDLKVGEYGIMSDNTIVWCVADGALKRYIYLGDPGLRNNDIDCLTCIPIKNGTLTIKVCG